METILLIPRDPLSKATAERCTLNPYGSCRGLKKRITVAGEYLGTTFP